MTKLSNNQQGTGPVELILVLVAVILIGLAGWLVYKDHHKNKSTAKNTAQKASSTSTSLSPRSGIPTSQNTMSADTATIMQRQQYIDNYVITNVTNNYILSYYAPLYNQGYLTQNFYKGIQEGTASDPNGPTSGINPAYDVILCINQTPTKYTYGKVSLNKYLDAASLPVNVYTANSNTPTPITEAWLQSDYGAWQLDGSACPQP